MADEIDLANDLTTRATELALSRIRKSMAKETKGAKFCVECEDPIPEARQKLGFKLCVPCAEEAERRKSLYNSGSIE